MGEGSSGEPMYEAFADAFAVHAGSGPYNAMYDRPALLALGFLVERIGEPMPVPEMAESDPEVFERLSREPGFIAFSLMPRPPLG